MKLWLKSDPSITADTLEDEPINGVLPARCFCPAAEPALLYAVIDPTEWSEIEIVPAPAGVPSSGYLVLYGDDPAKVKYLFVERETEAAVAIATRTDSFGYVSISIHRDAMIEPRRHEQ